MAKKSAITPAARPGARHAPTCSELRMSTLQWLRYPNMALRLAASSALHRSVAASIVVNTCSTSDTWGVIVGG